VVTVFRRTKPPGLHERLLDLAPVSIWACDSEYRIVLWNAGAAATYGYSRDEALGANYLDLFVKDDQREESQADTDAVIEKGAVFLCFIANDYAKEPSGLPEQSSTSTTDAPDRWLLTNCFQVTDDEGRPLQVEIAVDISPLSEQVEGSRSLGDLLDARLSGRADDIEGWKRGLDSVISLQSQQLKLAAASRQESINAVSPRDLSLRQRELLGKSKKRMRQTLEEETNGILEELEACKVAAPLVRSVPDQHALDRRMAQVRERIDQLVELAENFRG
jgi:hypothetical protein